MPMNRREVIASLVALITGLFTKKAKALPEPQDDPFRVRVEIRPELVPEGATTYRTPANLTELVYTDIRNMLDDI